MLGTVKGVIIEISPREEITSKDGSKSWEKMTVTLENTYSTGEYTNKNNYSVDFFGDKCSLIPANLAIGETLEIGVIVNSKKGGARWFTSLNCNGNVSFVSRATNQQPAPPVATRPPVNAPIAPISAPVAPSKGDDDDLPF